MSWCSEPTRAEMERERIDEHRKAVLRWNPDAACDRCGAGVDQCRCECRDGETAPCKGCEEWCDA